MKALAAEEIPAEVVGNGEGEAIHTVAGFKLAFEISTPNVVGGEDRAGGFSGVPDATAPAGNGNHPVAFEDVTNGGTAGQIPMGVAIVDYLKDLFSAPGRMLTTQFEQLGYDLRIGLVGEVVWFSGKVLEGAWSIINIAFNPFIAGFARDLITLAKLRQRESLFRKISDELNFLVHR